MMLQSYCYKRIKTAKCIAENVREGYCKTIHDPFRLFSAHF